MTLEELHEYIASQYGSESAHMFRQDPGIAIFKRTDNKKWFAARLLVFSNAPRKTL